MNLNKIILTCPTSTTNTFITIVFINTTRPIFAFVRLTFVDIFIAEFSFETLVTLTNGDFCIEINETTSMRTTKIIVTLMVVKLRSGYYYFLLKDKIYTLKLIFTRPVMDAQFHNFHPQIRWCSGIYTHHMCFHNGLNSEKKSSKSI